MQIRQQRDTYDMTQHKTMNNCINQFMHINTFKYVLLQQVQQKM